MTQEDRQQIDKKILELVNGCIRLKRDVDKLGDAVKEKIDADGENMNEKDCYDHWDLITLSTYLDLCCIHLVSGRLTKSDDEPEIGNQDSVVCIVGGLISSNWGANNDGK